MWRSRRGFTLIELLVAVGIAAMIALALGATFAAGLKIYRSIKLRGGARTDILLSLEKMEMDLRSMLPLSDITFDGGPNRITFAGIIKETDKKGNENRALGNITYYLDGSKKDLIREERNYSRALSGSDRGKITRRELITIKDIVFTYFIYDTELETYKWVNAWVPEAAPLEETETEGEEGVSATEEPEEEDKAKIPLGVKIELLYEDGDKELTRARTVFIPSAASRHLARLAAAREKEKKEAEESEKSK